MILRVEHVHNGRCEKNDVFLNLSDGNHCTAKNVGSSCGSDVALGKSIQTQSQSVCRKR